ncbi:MAG: hypothetical protein M0Z66_16130 [Thermaerobacter sp.]|nr:hypothetical protein [Thermaerobacter sp.]
MSQLRLLDLDLDLAIPSASGLAARAEEFCGAAPHRHDPFARRNWGGPLHSLCSYQGKLKPAIGHFLVSWFTEPGWRVLDPMSGVGTIPLEARRQGRIAVANDLSPLADCVSRAKVEPFDPHDVATIVDELAAFISSGPSLDQVASEDDLSFGLNGPIRDYFHADTLREVVLARRFFLVEQGLPLAARDVVRSSLLHILHGNRPYALSRRSHPVTPFSPTGPFEYRPVMERLTERLQRVLPLLEELMEVGLPGESHLGDFRDLECPTVDAVITSPPFAKSFRFWSMNWMRLWFAGWEREDFASEPKKYLETEQRQDFAPYGDFATAMHRLLRPGGVLVLHLGETASVNMAEELGPLIEPLFEIHHVGRECVLDTESHGLRDKGATVAHWYLFGTRRAD